MADYLKMRARLLQMQQMLTRAVEDLTPLNRIAQKEAYVLGLLRGCGANLAMAIESIRKIEPTPASQEQEDDHSGPSTTT